ncbi:FAD-dependent monooxygenase [Streptomyces sp. NPDC047022]|uniref:FAD-dependent monooxygenase n=1 Tax=Streptomyces sp. NPDC047022 TaxID=3155737 RepID=UPI0033C54F6F
MAEENVGVERLESRILVAGAGPVGAVLALELARYGVPSTIIERSFAPPLFPKMDYLNGRTMELFRRLGIADEVRSGGVSSEFASDFLWTCGFTGPPVAVWHHASPQDELAEAAKPNDGSAPLEPYQRITGSLLEELLRAKVRAHPLIELYEGWTVTGLEDHDDTGVTVHVVEAAGGVRRRLRTRWLAGCDGAGSAVRTALGIAMPVEGPRTNRCSVYFRSADPVLRTWGRAFVTTSSNGITMVSRDEQDSWTASFQVPDGEPFTGDPVAAMRDRLGVDFTVDEVLCLSSWQGTLAVAEHYSDRSVFLVGDAAHQFYPFGGHGANTGIADAVDLGWKLAAVENGWGGPDLLNSYQAERRPVAMFNREMSANLLEVWRRFGQLARDGASRAHLSGFLERQAHHVDNTGIHFGYRYGTSPVVAHEDGPEPRWSWSRIVPTTWPGGRPPSLRMADGSELFDHFGPGLTLVDTSADGAGATLAERAAQRGIPLRHLTIKDEPVRDAWERPLVLVRPDQHVAWRADEAPADADAVLDLVCGLAGVRPDGR